MLLLMTPVGLVDYAHEKLSRIDEMLEYRWSVVKSGETVRKIHEKAEFPI